MNDGVNDDCIRSRRPALGDRTKETDDFISSQKCAARGGDDFISLSGTRRTPSHFFEDLV